MSNPYTQGVYDLPEYERDHVMLDIDSHIPPKENLIVKYKVTAEVSIIEDEAQTMAEDEGNEDDFEDDKIEATRTNIREAVNDAVFDNFNLDNVEVIVLDG